MTAMAPSLHNRVAGRLHAPTPVPATAHEKQEAWANAVFAAAMLYVKQLSHPDADVAERAANAIFEMEKTRMRHGSQLMGTAEPNIAIPLPPMDTEEEQPRAKVANRETRLPKATPVAAKRTAEPDDAEIVETRELAKEYIRQHGLPQDERFLQSVVQQVIAKRRE